MWTDVPWSARWVTVGSLHRARLPLVPLYCTVHILRLPCIPWYPMSHREIEITDISRHGTDRRVLGTWRSAKRGPAHATPYYVSPFHKIEPRVATALSLKSLRGLTVMARNPSARWIRFRIVCFRKFAPLLLAGERR